MNPNENRRDFLKKAGIGAVIAPLTLSLGSFNFKKQSFNDINKPLSASGESTEVTLNITDFGAVGDGKTKNTTAIQHAIDRCSVFGGGKVIVPAGDFLTGAIALRSNVILHFEKDAILRGTPDFEDYPVTQVRWEGRWIQGHTALLYALDAENIGITGPGKIIGNPALGGRPNKEYPLRHPALIEPINCKNIRLEGFSASYYLMWAIHPTYCENITIKDLVIRSTGGNGDGIDIDSCKHVTIDGCDISTGDDCIAIKSGRGMEGNTLMRTTEDVQITNCTFADSIFACIGIGSESSGGIRNVRIKNCKFTAAKTFAIYIKSRPGRGAFIEDIVAEDLDVSGMEGGFLRFNTLGSGIKDPVPVPGFDGIPTTKNFSFSNVRVKDVPVLVEGTSIHPEKPLQGFKLTNVSGTCKKGISLANIQDAYLSDIKVTGYEGPLLSVSNVSGKGLEGAETIDPPKVEEPIPESETPFQLK